MMKKFKLTLSIIIIAITISSCAGLIEVNDNGNGKGTDSDANKTSILDGVNVNDLLSKQLGEVIDILGSNYLPEPIYDHGGPFIVYPDSCLIGYYVEYEEMNDSLQIYPEADVVAISVVQPIDIFKGISAGKTLSEINGNPDLKYQFAPTFDGTFNAFSDVGIYEHNGIFISIWPIFDENMICTYVFLKREDKNIPSIPDL